MVQDAKALYKNLDSEWLVRCENFPLQFNVLIKKKSETVNFYNYLFAITEFSDRKLLSLYNENVSLPRDKDMIHICGGGTSKDIHRYVM